MRGMPALLSAFVSFATQIVKNGLPSLTSEPPMRGCTTGEKTEEIPLCAIFNGARYRLAKLADFIFANTKQS